jgi:hypothetical protein
MLCNIVIYFMYWTIFAACFYSLSTLVLQGDMHRCSAKCCDVKTSGLDDVQRCVENCSIPLTQAQNFMQQEVENFQVNY